MYRHYRGENLPDAQFFDNALTDTFKVPAADVSDFKSIFLESLRSAQLIDEQTTGKIRLLDVSQQLEGVSESPEALRKVTKAANITAGDSCFVLMPFAPPLGNHYSLIYEPAIAKAGLRLVRADADIFATGKIMDQVWAGINAAKVLVAELTSRNPNVFYELAIAHALRKPVVLISSNEGDVPFDVRHIRVIYYDVSDPFWGEKLMNKVAENIVIGAEKSRGGDLQAGRVNNSRRSALDGSSAPLCYLLVRKLRNPCPFRGVLHRDSRDVASSVKI